MLCMELKTFSFMVLTTSGVGVERLAAMLADNNAEPLNESFENLEQCLVFLKDVCYDKIELPTGKSQQR